MTDDVTLRALERDAAGGDPAAQARLLAAEVRSGRVAAWQEELDELFRRVRARWHQDGGSRRARTAHRADAADRLTTAAVDVAFGLLLGRDPRRDGAVLVARAWDVPWGRERPGGPATPVPIVFGVVAARGRVARLWLGLGEAEPVHRLEDEQCAGVARADLEERLVGLDALRSPAWALEAARSTVLAWLAGARGPTL